MTISLLDDVIMIFCLQQQHQNAFAKHWIMQSDGWFYMMLSHWSPNKIVKTSFTFTMYSWKHVLLFLSISLNFLRGFSGKCLSIRVFVLSRWQAISWTNNDTICWHRYVITWMSSMSFYTEWFCYFGNSNIATIKTLWFWIFSFLKLHPLGLQNEEADEKVNGIKTTSI